jgi:hypothetical protein
MSIINVQTKEVVTTRVITQVEILEGNIQLNQSARFPVRLSDSNGNLVSMEFVIIEGDDYDNWASDDSYIASLILTRLGIEPIVEA